MVALTELYQALWSGRIPNVAPGQPFWARYADSSGLIAGGLARLWTARRWGCGLLSSRTPRTASPASRRAPQKTQQSEGRWCKW
jgi:hypothetical protein